MKTVVVGASPNSFRYSFRAVNSLLSNNEEVVALGIKKGTISGIEILDIRENPRIEDVNTLTIYVSPENLSGYEDYLLSLNPARIIFNPGAENYRFQEKADTLGIETINACTLVMLSAGTY